MHQRRGEAVPGLFFVARRLEVPGEQGPDVLGADAVPRIGAEQGVLDLCAEAALAEPFVLAVPLAGRPLRLRLQGQRRWGCLPSRDRGG